ncbi:MAG: head-tail adaptor protein [Gemmobacter sp.]
MSVPRLGVPLVLEAPLASPDGKGGQAKVWQALGTLWADLVAGAGREVVREALPEGAVVWRITVRAAPVGAPSRPRAGQRFRLGLRLFPILAVAETGPEGRYLVCHAREEEPA